MQLLHGIIALFLHLYKLPAVKTTEVLSVVNMAELVTNDAGIADCCIYVGVRVPENPCIDTAVGNKVAQLRCEGTI